MPVRPFIAILLLINYLLVVAAGCVNRPEDQRERLLVQTTHSESGGQSYQQCRYLRMDELETFLAEALATRYETATKLPSHHLFFVVNGVDAHYLPCVSWPVFKLVYPVTPPAAGYETPVSPGVCRAPYTPPWLG